MKLAIIKAIISWLYRHHRKTIKQTGFHLSANPTKRPINPAVSGTDE